MFKIGKILVPVDFSECSRHALEWALDLASKVGARVHVFYVWDPPSYLLPDVTVFVPGQPPQTMSQYAKAHALEEMAAFLAKVDRPREVALDTEAVAGVAADEVLKLAEQQAYDLIVMGTHGRTGVQRVFLGSTAEKVVRRATCPVLTLRQPEK